MCLLETGKVDIHYEGRKLETVEFEGTGSEMPLVDDDARSWLAFDPLRRWFPGPAGGSPMHCVVSSC